ncbi:unnamed protein product [Larinioides sclopetarius]
MPTRSKDLIVPERTAWASSRYYGNMQQAPPIGRKYQEFNFIVAVRIENSTLKHRIKKLQVAIARRNKVLKPFLKETGLLHATLLKVAINDEETHQRARKALQNVLFEVSEGMLQDPLQLLIEGVSTFNNNETKC